MTSRGAAPYDRLDDATILRYLGGECEPAERARVERWLDLDPQHRAELAALQAAWNPPPVAEADSDDRMWQWLAAHLEAPMPVLVSRPAIVPILQLPRRSPSYLRTLGLIAAVAVLLVGAVVLRISGQLPGGGLSGWLAGAGTQEFVTPRGSRVTGNLPDGSRVIVAPDSRLRIPATFAATGRGTRDVYLQSGEAFFEVTHDATRPFRVHTATGVVEDLGTAFVVTAYPETGTTRAVVASGVVTLRGRRTAAGRGMTLRAGDLGLVDATGVATRQQRVNVAAYVGWTKGELVFDAVPLADALTTLGRWYDLDIRLADTALSRRRFTATFQDEPFAHVLRALEIALDVRGERRGRLVTLQPHSR